MEKTEQESHISESILGFLYDDIKIDEEEAVLSFINLDYEKSINLLYDLDETMVQHALKD